MRFGTLKRHWGRLGRRDPFWAVLTDADKRGGRWDVAEFFHRGQLEIDAVLARARETGMAPAQARRALDFGCGAGRLTQAMAAHFSQCDGVDISEPMLRVARQHNRFPDRCTYHLNARPDLSLFADASFDFVYSTLVLQHMAPRYSTRYVHELVRVLAPGGLLVFQLPSQRSTQEPPAEARQTPIHGRLPDAACRAALTADASSLSVNAGADVTLEVTAENRSPHPWPALPDALGRYGINVANHWLDENGDVVQRDDGRCPLPWDVAPAARASAMLIMTAPAEDGVYQVELDLVQEDVGWFADRGSATLRVPVMVGLGRDTPKRPPPVVPPEPPTFRTKHPRAFRTLSAIGVRDVYWSYRRGLDRIRSARDAVIVGVRDGLNLPRLMNWLRRRDFMTGRMEMYWVPRAEVISVVTAAGGRVTDVVEEWTPGYQSCRYWIRKD